MVPACLPILLQDQLKVFLVHIQIQVVPQSEVNIHHIILTLQWVDLMEITLVVSLLIQKYFVYEFENLKINYLAYIALMFTCLLQAQ